MSRRPCDVTTSGMSGAVLLVMKLFVAGEMEICRVGRG